MLWQLDQHPEHAAAVLPWKAFFLPLFFLPAFRQMLTFSHFSVFFITDRRTRGQ